MRKALASLAFVALSAMAAPAAADDFVFNVPVRIENADAIVSALADCTVNYRTDLAGEQRANERAVVPVSGGDYSGTIPVRVALPDGVTRTNASQWECTVNLLMQNTDGTRTWLSGADAARRAQYTAATGRTVTSSAARTIQSFSRP